MSRSASRTRGGTRADARRPERAPLLFFGTTMPGIGVIAAREIKQAVPGAQVAKVGFDGRSDVVPFSARGRVRAEDLRTVEDLFAQVGYARDVSSLGPLLARLWIDRRVERALAAHGRAVAADRRTTFRVVARVRDERRFLRTQLRSALTARISEGHRRWKEADPAGLEFWVLQDGAGSFRLGLRLTGRSQRQRGGRAVERSGALRPSVAAAIVFGLGDAGAGRRLLDPCCGSGTILAEGRASGWNVTGTDLDVSAVKAARRNIAGPVDVEQADVRELPFKDGTFDAVASNLPFGQQFPIPRPHERWFADALAEIARIVKPGSPVSLLVPTTEAFKQALDRVDALALKHTHDITLLGTATTIFSLRRR